MVYYKKKKKLLTYTDKKGYKHFSNSKKPVHRYVAERKLGGEIWDDYVVHHKDGNKQNNRRSNLQVMSKEAHSRLHYYKRNKKQTRKKRKKWDNW